MNALIFDVDGTLFQTDRILAPALEHTFTTLRERRDWTGPAPVDTYQQMMGKPLPEVWQTLLPDHPDDVHEEMDGLFQKALVQRIQAGDGALYPHVRDVLRALKQEGFTLFAASNGRTDYLQAVAAQERLDGLFEGIYSIDHLVSGDKTDLVCHVIDTHGITSGAMVGDRLSDIQAGQQNGLKAVGCRFTYAQEVEMAQADVTVDDFRELLPLFRG
ncbi:HAD family hydrolase [Alkalicoccus chagannorensis]|uniref:HAD family hydrolase n=1 Tax=Alkalicoccus chagannorensis TaxID=427072 RepID=UPI001FE0B3E8|nr:HAD family hydrolase [Alkalicoccus chagannorensis]